MDAERESSQGKGVMSASDEALEKRLLEAGKNLLDPLPSSVQNLLQLLDKIFLCLLNFDHPGSLQNALSPLMKSLVAARLLKHSNVDVKVAVTACITEVMRLTAPNAPYDDHKMKEVFQLIVSSFEHLPDKSSPSFTKVTSILETVAKTRACVMMLDIGCDALVIEMFQHFLKGVRDHHSENVFSYMENIMTLVLEESEDITPEMLSPILHYVKDDDEIAQVARKLAQQVLVNCASKLKTYLAEAVNSSGVSLDKYSNVVASICEEAFSALKQKQKEVVAHKEEQDKHKAVEVSTPEQTCVAKGRLNLELSLVSPPHDSSVNAAISCINENGHEAVSPRRETVAEAGVKRTHEMAEEEDPAETETLTHKRARVQSCSLPKAHGEMEKTAAEGEPSDKSNVETGDLQRKKVPKPCSITHQLAKVKQSIVDTITSVRQFRTELETKEQIIIETLNTVWQFRSEIKEKEDNLEASLQEIDVLGEKISGINKILN